jgi:hypothetical protein
MDKKIGHPKAARNSRQKFSGNSAEAQRARLIERLSQQGAITTIEARRDLDILMPAARIFELRDMGHHIDTIWTDEATDAGHKHRVARYVLVKGM